MTVRTRSVLSEAGTYGRLEEPCHLVTAQTLLRAIAQAVADVKALAGRYREIVDLSDAVAAAEVAAERARLEIAVP